MIRHLSLKSHTPPDLFFSVFFSVRFFPFFPHREIEDLDQAPLKISFFVKSRKIAQQGRKIFRVLPRRAKKFLEIFRIIEELEILQIIEDFDT